MAGGRISKLCADSRTMERAAQLIAEGLSDQTIADRLGLAGAAGRMVVQRHRTRHVEAPARAVAEAASKGRQAVTRREGLVAAAEAGDPMAFLELAQIVSDLQRAYQRLERVAGDAEKDRQRGVVSSLAAQQIKAAEVRARIAGIGSYASQKTRAETEATTFNLNIIFSNGQKQQIISTPTIEAEFDMLDDGREKR